MGGGRDGVGPQGVLRRKRERRQTIPFFSIGENKLDVGRSRYGSDRLVDMVAGERSGGRALVRCLLGEGSP